MCLALGRASPPCPSDMLWFLTHQGKSMSNIHLKSPQTFYCEAASVTSAPASPALPELPGFLRKHSTQGSQPSDCWLPDSMTCMQVHAELLSQALAGTSSQKAFLHQVWLSYESFRSPLESFKCF